MAALEHNDGYTFDDIAGFIASGVMQLWPARRGCMVTEIIQYPRKRVLGIVLAAGDLDQLQDMGPDVAEWAKAQGCASAMLFGRVGWQRALPDWTVRAVIMERKI
jgi:hypothetical protein